MVEDDGYSATEDLNIQEKASSVSSCEICEKRLKRKGGLSGHMYEDNRKIARKTQVVNWSKMIAF